MNSSRISVCGKGGALSRFGQLTPKLMIATAGYEFSGKYYDRCDAVEEIARSLPSLRHVIVVDRLGRGRSLELPQDAEPWVEALAAPATDTHSAETCGAGIDTAALSASTAPNRPFAVCWA